MLTRQVKVQIRKCTLIILTIRTKNADSGEKKHFSIHFFVQRMRLFHLLVGNVRAQSVRNGHQSVNSRADTKNINTNKRSKVSQKLESTDKFIRKIEIREGNHGFILKCTYGPTAHRLETFIMFCSSFLLGCCRTVPYSFVALLVDWVNTELFP